MTRTMTRTTTRRAAAALLMIGGAVGAQAVAAGPASAVTPTCSTSTVHQSAVVPSTSGGNVNCNMVRGNVSEGVRQLQDTLNDCYESALRREGVYPLVRDADFGGDTQRALRAVQRVVGTSADGVYGPNTRRAMKHPDINFGNPCRRVG